MARKLTPNEATRADGCNLDAGRPSENSAGGGNEELYPIVPSRNRPREGWRNQAACRGTRDLDWFATGRGVGKDLDELCAGCPVAEDCIVDGLLIPANGGTPGRRYGMGREALEQTRQRAAQQGVVILPEDAAQSPFHGHSDELFQALARALADGQSYRQVADTLNADPNLPPSPSGTPWARASVNNLVRRMHGWMLGKLLDEVEPRIGAVREDLEAARDGLAAAAEGLGVDLDGLDDYLAHLSEPTEDDLDALEDEL